MDRLVCGDVGFGKTEVAIRAVFKAVQDGTQAAILVPTTLLASQHAQTFAERYAPLPGPGRAAQPLPLPGPAARRSCRAWPTAASTSSSARTGCWPRTCSSRSLGLLVVDEEQRFGVTHKEAVKRIAEGVDVLTLTASPIPRTLEMALTGIRDLSMVNTPPADRRPDPHLRGRARHGRGERGDPPRAAARGPGVLRAQPGVGHRPRGARPARPGARGAGGRRPRADGRGRASRRWCSTSGSSRYDVLVCTTIIESGIDMPSVNTLDRRPGRPPRARPAPPDPRPGGPGRPAGLRLPLPSGGPRPVRAGLRAAAHHRRAHRAGLRLQDRHARPRDPGGGQPVGVGPVGAHRRRGLRPLRAAGGRGGGRGTGGAAARRRRRSRSTSPATRTCRRTTSPPRTPASRRTAGWPPRCPSTTSTTSGPSGPTGTARCPAPAEGLLCSRSPPRASALARGIGEVAMSSVRPGGTQRPVVRLSPVALPASAQVRLRRVVPGATYRDDLAQLLLPVPDGAPAAESVRGVIEELLPVAQGDSNSRRGQLVECPAREVAPRPPRPARWRRRRGGVRRAHERGHRQRHHDQPGHAQLGHHRHRREPRLPVLPELGGLPVVQRQPAGAAPGDRRGPGPEPRRHPHRQLCVRRDVPGHRDRPPDRAAARRRAERHGDADDLDRGAVQPDRADRQRHERGRADGRGRQPALHLRGDHRAADGRRRARLAARVVRGPTGAIRRHRQRSAGGPGRASARVESDLQAYYERHSSEFDTVCFNAAEFTSESSAGGRAGGGRTRGRPSPGRELGHPERDDPVQPSSSPSPASWAPTSRRCRASPSTRPRRRSRQRELRRAPAEQADPDALRHGQGRSCPQAVQEAGRRRRRRPPSARPSVTPRCTSTRATARGSRRRLDPHAVRPGAVRRPQRAGQRARRSRPRRAPSAAERGRPPPRRRGGPRARRRRSHRPGAAALLLRTAPASGCARPGIRRPRRSRGRRASTTSTTRPTRSTEVYDGHRRTAGGGGRGGGARTGRLRGARLAARGRAHGRRCCAPTQRVEVSIVPALSFLDLAWGALGVDPLADGVRLVDATEFAAAAAAERGPFLVAQCWSRHLLSEVKLAVADDGDGVAAARGAAPSRSRRRGGGAVDWWELDRTVEPDHLTSLYVPRLASPGAPPPACRWRAWSR